MTDLSDLIWARWRLVPNPGWTGTPRIVDAICHDRSPFLTVQCSCGATNHFHETQFDNVPDDTDLIIESRCKSCGRVMTFEISFIRGAFQRMRDEGWIAPRSV